MDFLDLCDFLDFPDFLDILDMLDCRGCRAMRNVKHKMNEKDSITRGQLREIFQAVVDKSPVFSSVPEGLKKQLIPRVLHGVQPLPKGSVVFLYDGEIDGKSTSEEFVPQNPHLKDKVFGFLTS